METAGSIMATNEGQPSYAALNAVANAMMATQLAWLSPYLYLTQEVKPVEKVIKKTDELLKENSERECDTGSRIAIDFLARNHQELFSHIFRVVSYRDDRHPFTHFKGHSHVAYFMARDKKGFWHAATPGNDAPDDVINPLIHPIPASQNLADVMKEIHEREGGSWPTPEYIEEQLFKDDTVYQHPQRTNERITNMGPAEFMQQLFTIENDRFGRNDAYIDLMATTDLDLLRDPLIALKQKRFDIHQYEFTELDVQARRLSFAKKT